MRPRRVPVLLLAAAAVGAGGAVTATVSATATVASAPAPATAARGAETAARARATTSAPTPLCRPVTGVTRTVGGGLYLLRDDAVLRGAGSLRDLGQIGYGWTRFTWTGSGGDGVVYALTRHGVLHWYRFDNATMAWAPGSGRVIARGLTPGERVAGIAAGPRGDLYVLRADGRLALYRHTGRLTGAATWANPHGYPLRAGWQRGDVLVPAGRGVLYRQHAGVLSWYRHTDPGAGRVRWTGPRRVATGWRFYDLQSAGAGVIYAVARPSGAVLQFRHADPGRGSPRWITRPTTRPVWTTAPPGVRKGTVRPDSLGLDLDAGACR